MTTLYPQAIYGKAHDRDSELDRTTEYQWLVRTAGFPAGLQSSLTRYRLFNARRDISPTWDANRYKDRYAVGVFPLELGDGARTHILVEYQISRLPDSQSRYAQMQRYVHLGWVENWQELIEFVSRTRNDYLVVYQDQRDDYPAYQFGEQPSPFAHDPDIPIQAAFLVIDALFSGTQIVMQGDVRDEFADWHSRSAFTLLRDVLDRLPAQLAPYVSFAVGDVNPSEAQEFDLIICPASDVEKLNHRIQHRFRRDDYHRRDHSVTGLYASWLLHDKAAFANRDCNTERYAVKEFLDLEKRPALERAILDAIDAGTVEAKPQLEPTPSLQQQQRTQPSALSYDQPTVQPNAPSSTPRDYPLPAFTEDIKENLSLPPYLLGDSDITGQAPTRGMDHPEHSNPAQPPISAAPLPSNTPANLGDSQPPTPTSADVPPGTQNGKLSGFGLYTQNKNLMVLFTISLVILVLVVIIQLVMPTPPSSPTITPSIDPHIQTVVVDAATLTAELIETLDTAESSSAAPTVSLETPAPTPDLTATQLQILLLTATQELANETTLLAAQGTIVALAAQRTVQAIAAQTQTAPPTPSAANKPIAYAFVTGEGLNGDCLNLRSEPSFGDNILAQVSPGDAYAVYEISPYRMSDGSNLNFLRIHSTQPYWIVERGGNSQVLAVVQYRDIDSLIAANPSLAGIIGDSLLELLSGTSRDCSGQSTPDRNATSVQIAPVTATQAAANQTLEREGVGQTVTAAAGTVAAETIRRTVEAITAQTPTALPTSPPANQPIAYAFVTGDGLNGRCLNLRSGPPFESNIIGQVSLGDAYAVYEISAYPFLDGRNLNFLRIHSTQQYWVAERSTSASPLAVVQYPDEASLIAAHPNVAGVSGDAVVEALSRTSRDCSGQ